jgi:hypothetical protein
LSIDIFPNFVAFLLINKQLTIWAAARKGHVVSEETKEKIRKTVAETRAKKKALLEG